MKIQVGRDPAENFNNLLSLVDLMITTPDSELYRRMMTFLKEDQSHGGTYFLGMERAPAAKKNHHAYEGGLVRHLLEMWEYWLLLRENTAATEFINDERVLKAILNHDLHKAYRTYVLVNRSPWEVDYGRDETDQFMTWDVKSIWLLMQHGIKLDVQQMNALLWAEGGFSKIKPYECTALSKLCYLLDELSGNVHCKVETGQLLGRPPR